MSKFLYHEIQHHLLNYQPYLDQEKSSEETIGIQPYYTAFASKISIRFTVWMTNRGSHYKTKSVWKRSKKLVWIIWKRIKITFWHVIRNFGGKQSTSKTHLRSKSNTRYGSSSIGTSSYRTKKFLPRYQPCQLWLAYLFPINIIWQANLVPCITETERCIIWQMYFLIFHHVPFLENPSYNLNTTRS